MIEAEIAYWNKYKQRVIAERDANIAKLEELRCAECKQYTTWLKEVMEKHSAVSSEQGAVNSEQLTVNN